MQDVPESCQLPQVFHNLPDPVAAVFKVTGSSPRLPSVVELGEDGMMLNRPAKRIPPVTAMYDSRSTLHCDAKWWIAKRPTQMRTLDQPRASGPCQIMEGVVLNRQRMLYEMMGQAGLEKKEVKVKEEYQFMEVADMTELSVSLEHGSHRVEKMRKAREAMYTI